MNSKIKELAEQADPDHWHERWYSGINPRMMDPEIRKFAELIVRECAKVADEHDCNLSGNGGEILKHFGVE